MENFSKKGEGGEERDIKTIRRKNKENWGSLSINLSIASSNPKINRWTRMEVRVYMEN